MNRRNPDDLTLLHRMRMKVRQYKIGFAIDVYDGSERIAMAKFFQGLWTAMPWDKVVETVLIEVQRPYQRKGVASAIYRKVEELGYTLHPSSKQTPDGEAMWRGGRWGKREEIINSGIMQSWKRKFARPNPERCNKPAIWMFPNSYKLCKECLRDYPWIADGLEPEMIDAREGHGCDRPIDGLGARRHPRGGRRPRSEMWRENPGNEAELVRLAFAEYGVTRDFRECGYIMTDGRMLDFSEKRDGGNPGTRSLDHRAVGGVLKKAGFVGVPAQKGSKKTLTDLLGDMSYGSNSDAVRGFLEACGAVRVMFMEGGGSYRGKPVGNIFYLHVARRPTAAQLLTIAGAIRKHSPELVQVAFGESVDMVEIEPVTAGRVRQVLESLS